MKSKVYYIAVLIVLLGKSYFNYGLNEHMSVVDNSKYESKTLCKNVVIHKFSSIDQVDTFKIYILGDSLLKSTVYFEIINSFGEKIYSQKFESYLLLNYDISSETTYVAKEMFIKDRIANFFSEDKFTFPAIGDKETFDSNYSSKLIWDDIRSDNKAIGFHYLIGEEDGRSIAYSKKQKKVVLYFNCC